MCGSRETLRKGTDAVPLFSLQIEEKNGRRWPLSGGQLCLCALAVCTPLIFSKIPPHSPGALLYPRGDVKDAHYARQKGMAR